MMTSFFHRESFPTLTRPSRILNKGYMVRYHDEPVEDNLPGTESLPPVIDQLLLGQSWGFTGIDPRRQNNDPRTNAKLLLISPSIIQNLSLMDLFMLLFPVDYIKTTIIP